MSALSPGLYRATVEGVPNIIIMIADEYGRGTTSRCVPDTPYGTRGHDRDNITDARPLIVLDLENPAAVVRSLRTATRYSDEVLPYLDQVAASIEAQTKPARIPEPGLWGVVEASSIYVNDRLTYVHHNKPGPWAWATQSRGSCKWDDLIDPTLIREGLS